MENNKRVTAVEWLEMEIVKLEANYAIPNAIYELCEIAKEMENEQKIILELHSTMSDTVKVLTEIYTNHKL